VKDLFSSETNSWMKDLFSSETNSWNIILRAG
jgi:hypothetical protein